jgi:hypothetical protein
MSAATQIPVRLLPSGRRLDMDQRDFVEIAPDEFIAFCPPALVPRIGVAKFRRNSAGHWEPIIQALPALVHRSQWKPDIYGCSWYTAVRLALAGFVEFMKPGPRTTSIVLESYFAHLLETRNNPVFWNETRLKLFDEVKLRAAEVAESDEEILSKEQAVEKRLGPQLPLKPKP